jgi:CheY-like chemotaxis protein
MSNVKRILVIEDDAILRELLADWLLAAGYRVGTAAEGSSGITQARLDRPDLVVTDIHMPGLGGAAVISQVVKLYPGIPIIAISAHFRSDLGLSPSGAHALGASRTLGKPFTRGEVMGAVIALAGPPAR